MTIRKLLLAAASIAAIVPAVSYASEEENAALTACAQAFATSLASSSGTPTFKVKYHSESAGALGDFYRSRQYTFDLQAHDPKTGSTLAHATCSTDTSGTVVALTATNGTPALAARL